MGLMDRDYYREKKTAGSGTFSPLIRLKENPLAVVILIILVLLVLSIIL
jgi:hypothetical protein